MIINYSKWDEDSISIKEANRILNEKAEKQGYESYNALRDAYAKRRGFKDWETYRGFLIRRKEEKNESEKRKINKRKRKRYRRKRIKISSSPRQFRNDGKLEKLFRKDKLTKSELTNALCLMEVF